LTRVANFPWTKLIVGPNGKIRMVQCKVYSIVEHEEKLLVFKLDGLKEHNDKQMCKVDWPNKELGKSYINFDKQHVENEKICTITRCDGIQLQAMQHNKIITIHCIFHLLKLWKPITNFDSIHKLL
jgi:hypothetical protein